MSTTAPMTERRADALRLMAQIIETASDLSLDAQRASLMTRIAEGETRASVTDLLDLVEAEIARRAEAAGSAL